MVKLIIFDLDGVLADARELHYLSLNRALELVDNQYTIGKEEHLSTYDGLPTMKKLQLLTKNKNLSEKYYTQIWTDKQIFTKELINSLFTRDDRIITILRNLKERDYKIYVASNSIRETVKLTLLRKGFLEFIDNYYSNEDVKKPKPSTEIYLKCMVDAGVDPCETLIIEDSYVGRKAAKSSGAFLCPVINPDDLTLEKLNTCIINYEAKSTANLKLMWQDPKLNVLIPMAGAGTRFEKAGYTFPKPLIDVKNKPMIQVVVESLNVDANYIFIAQEDHYKKYNLNETLHLISPSCKIVTTTGLTEGAACTTLLAKDIITDGPLLLANSDQFLDWDSSEFMYSMMADNIDGGILVFESTHPKWSYAKLDSAGFVCEVAVKIPISNLATVGVYFWKNGRDYVKYAEKMIEKNIRVNNEFYVCPVFNEAIQDGKKIKVFKIDSSKMWGLGTPEDLVYYVNNYGTNSSQR